MSEPISRRTAITGVAVGGAVVWAAPSIMSVSAASAATVPPGDNLLLDASFQDSDPGLFLPPWELVV